MYYHVVIKANGKIFSELDKDNLDEIKNDIVKPYLENEDFYFDSRFLNRQSITDFSIKKSELTSKDILHKIKIRLGNNIVFAVNPRDIIVENNEHTINITKNILKEVGITGSKNIYVENNLVKNKQEIFIVHGRDNESKISVARFIEQLGLEAIILHEQSNAGKTIIEKIEEHTDVGFAIVLYTPCDLGGLKESEERKPRARQNVVFEHGYLIAKLGRPRVCALVKEEVEFPSDINGMVYLTFDNSGAWAYKIADELNKVGYQIDKNKIKI
jgi:hypothetical protein